jgi:hypothetical protein
MEDNLNNRIYKAKKVYVNETLDSRFNKIPIELSKVEKINLLDLLTKGCRARTKRKISLLLNVPLQFWFNQGIFNRVTFYNDNKGVYYCTGQDWHSEKKTLLKCIEGYYD